MPHIRNIDEVTESPVQMDGVAGVNMAMLCGREHGAPHFALRCFRVEPGGHTPRHHHDYEHEVFVVEGEGQVLLEGEFRDLRKGDAVLVPAEEEHQFRGGPQGMRFLCLVPVERNCGGETPGS